MINLSNIKAEMARRNMFQKDLAKELNIAISTMHLKLSGKREFTLLEVDKMIKIFDKDILFFLAWFCHLTTRKEKQWLMFT